MKIFKIIIFIFLFNFICVLNVYAFSDLDADGLSDEQETFFYYTDPNNFDTDGDGYGDKQEIGNGFSPHKGGGAKIDENDYDNDGLSDWHEMWFGSDIGKSDSDGDGFNDYQEVLNGYDPTDASKIKKYTKKIEIDKAKQELRYIIDKITMKVFSVSTGNPGTETPSGAFSILNKVASMSYTGPGYSFKNVKWNMMFKSPFFIHTAYWHNDFGKRTRSHGCVNMRAEDAKFLYDYADIGTPVIISGETPAKYFVKT
jgi:hypothetical protein